jgi:pimeloyl-ACP methyl ester carboxylesterase
MSDGGEIFSPDLSPVEHTRVRVRAGRGTPDLLAYRLYERNGCSDSVLLLHGLGSAAVDWSMQTAVLSGHFHVAAFDFPGHGESQPVPRRTTIRDLSSRVFRTAEHLQLKPGIVVGHSLGGLVALQMVLEAPEMFKALVLVNAVPRMTFSRHAARQAAGRLPDVLRNRMGRLAEFVASEHFPGAEQDLLRRMAVRRIRSADRNTYLHLIRAIARFDVRSRLKSICIPVLVVSGTEDRVFSDRDKRILAQRIPQAEWVEMEGSGHASPQDSPEQFNRILYSFLDRVNGYESKRDESVLP